MESNILPPEQLISGLFSLFFVIISLIVGVMLILKYIRYKQRNFLLVGLTWIGMVSIWYPSAINVIIFSFSGSRIPDLLFMAIGNGLIPITTFIWMITFTDLLYKEKQKIILLIFGIISALIEIFFFYFLLTEPSVLGKVVSPVDATWTLPITLYQIAAIVMVLITGTLIWRESLKSSDPEVILKGKLLLAAVFSFVTGCILEIFSDVSIILLIIGRLILISAAIEFYLGWILPDWIKNRLLKES
ncbi:MAG: hypothetical protein EU529_09165 [Promethearchaeota archaeon]|nr:MAG: hypothetical protein EU529_09165 [Candidatus Lokiarchaeota archaeon]